jgi:hypothetical protein
MRKFFWAGLATALVLTACNFSSSSPTAPLNTATWTATATATATSTGAAEDASASGSHTPDAGSDGASSDATVDGASSPLDASIDSTPPDSGRSNDGGTAEIPTNSGIVTLASSSTDGGIGYSEVTASFLQNQAPALTFWTYDVDAGAAGVTTALTDLFLDAGAQYSDAGYFYYKDSGAIVYEDGGVFYDDAGVLFGFLSFGACEVIEVGSALGSDGGSDAGTSTGGNGYVEVSAGTLTVTGGTAPIVIAPTTSGANVSYSYVAATGTGDGGPSFAAGDTLTVSASGGAAPAFTATIALPGTIQITEPPPPSPTLPDGAVLPLPTLTTPIGRTAALTIAWTGGSSGNVLVALGESGGAAVECLFPESAGRGVIPAAALAYLAPTPADGGANALLTIAPLSTSTVVTSGWGIQLQANGNGGYLAFAVIQ